MRQILFGLSGLAMFGVPVAAAAQENVALSSKVYVARSVTDANGKKSNQLFDPDKSAVLPGEPLVVMINYKNNGRQPATAFVINNPIPAAVSFTGVEEPWATVSVDGGKTFGPLASLKVPRGDGTLRPAIHADVTAVRWKFAQAIAPGAAGRVSFYGTVK